MNILIAPDKFKGSLSGRAVAEAVSRGIQSVDPTISLRIHPMADGGDGSLVILKDILALQTRTVNTVDPLGRPIQASYAYRGDQAYVELAAASGIALLKNEELNPLQTSTFGTGILIKDAVANGCRKIYLFLGGSATNDMGFGIAAALGFEFFATSLAIKTPTGESLGKIDEINAPNTLPNDLQITMLCDVNNPLYGPNGAAHVYAAQKGADAAMIQQLDDGCRSSKAVIERRFGVDVGHIPGGGAAGGVAAGLYGLFGASIEPGFATIAQLTQLEEAIQWADLVISGEGKLDEQSMQGKVVGGISRLCQKHQKQLRLVVGASDFSELAGVKSIHAVDQLAADLEDSMRNAERYLEVIGHQLLAEHNRI